MAPTKAERRLRVAVVGVGLVGSELLRQLAAHSQGPCGARGVRLELAAICTSKRMHLLPAPDARAVFATPLQAAAASARVSELLETCRAIGAPLGACQGPAGRVDSQRSLTARVAVGVCSTS